MSTSAPEGGARYGAALVLIVSLFFMWGVANSLNDILVPHFKKAFTLTDLQSGLVQSAFYFGYFALAAPAAMFMRRFGYKAAVIAGLALYGAGALLFYPAAEALQYWPFLAALFVIASGLAFLETSANPLVTVLGAVESAERRLNFAQAFNPLGTITGVLVGRQFIFSDGDPAAILTQSQLVAEARSVQAPYLVIGLIVLAWAALVLVVKFPPVATAREAREEKGAGFAGLVRYGHFLWAVAAQFFYVGAQVCVWSYLIRYTQHALPDVAERGAANFLTYALIAFLIGRFASTALMRFVAPARLLLLYALASAALTAVAVAAPGAVGVWALVGVSFFMSIMFPTIFALGLKGLGAEAKSGASFLVMAIIGGAVLTALMGQVSDLSAIHYAYAVPGACFLFIALYAAAFHKPRGAS
jgi:MFS transporter, FHS family, L-fucose permease